MRSRANGTRVNGDPTVPQDDPDHSILTTSQVVCQSAKSRCGHTKRTSSRARSSKTTSVKFSPECSCTEPLRLEVIQHVLLERGFSLRTAEEMLRTVQKSSSKVCQGKWSVLFRCHHRNTSPHRATLFSRCTERLPSLSLSRGESIGVCH